MAASENTCEHLTADQEVSVKTLAEELKTLADAAQVSGSETRVFEGHMCLLFQVCSFIGALTTVTTKDSTWR